MKGDEFTMISNGYNMIKWGILISIIHIYLFGTFEIIPAFIGYFLIMRGVHMICDETGLDYMQSLKKESVRLFIFSCAYWIAGLFLGYQLALEKMILVLFYLFDVLFFGNLLNKTIKYLKEKMRLDEADKLRKNRMTFVKAYMGLIIFYCVTMVPNLLHFLNIGSDSLINMLATILQYIFISLMLVIKLLLSAIIQKYSIR